jgi:hypothetical protein
MRGISIVAVAVAGLVVGCYGAWVLWRGVESESWLSVSIGALAAFAGLAMLARQSWSRFLLYAVVAIICVSWTYAAIAAVRAGAWERYDALWIFLSHTQGTANVVVALICALIANRFLRPVSRRPNKSLERTREG